MSGKRRYYFSLQAEDSSMIGIEPCISFEEFYPKLFIFPLLSCESFELLASCPTSIERFTDILNLKRKESMIAHLENIENILKYKEKSVFTMHWKSYMKLT